MAELKPVQLAEFNGKKGFIVVIKNDADETRMYFDGETYSYGERYPLNKPENSGVSLNQRGNGEIYNYFYGPAEGESINGAIRYRVNFDQTMTSIYLYVGFKNEEDGSGYFISLKAASSDEELREAVHNSTLKEKKDVDYRGMWHACADYERYANSATVKQIRVTFYRRWR